MTVTTYAQGGVIQGGQPAKWIGTITVGTTATDTPRPHQCPHGCKRDRHPDPLTEQVARMYDQHAFREDYSPESDDSPIVCVGADYHGPNRAIQEPVRQSGYIYIGQSSPSWLTMMIKSAEEFTKAYIEWPKFEYTTTFQWPKPYWHSWIDEPYGSKTLKPLPACELDLVVTFDDAWKPWEKAHPTKYEAAAARELVGHITNAAIRAEREFPVPERPGYDFSKYAEETKPYYLGDKK